MTWQPAKHSLSTPTSVSTHEFVLQLEGKSKWILRKVHQSEGNVEETSSSLIDAERIFEVSSGDGLYIPTGWTVTEEAMDGDPSLFLSLRTSSSNTVSNLLKLTVSQAIENLHVENRLFRKLLPPDIGGYMGVAMSENDEDPKRQILMNDLGNLLNIVVSQSLEIIDAAHDQVRSNFFQ
jgi:hypothetical protein